MIAVFLFGLGEVPLFRLLIALHPRVYGGQPEPCLGTRTRRSRALPSGSWTCSGETALPNWGIRSCSLQQTNRKENNNQLDLDRLGSAPFSTSSLNLAEESGLQKWGIWLLLHVCHTGQASLGRESPYHPSPPMKCQRGLPNQKSRAPVSNVGKGGSGNPWAKYHFWKESAMCQAGILLFRSKGVLDVTWHHKQ